MLHKVLLRDGQHLSVRLLGKGQPIILLHGFGSESRHWLPNIIPFLNRFQFILPDLRGFGSSHQLHFGESNAFIDYANDLHDVINHFQLKQFYLGGISTGAYACLTYNHLYGFQQVERYLNIEHSYCSVNNDQPHGIFRERQQEVFEKFSYLLSSIEQIESPWDYWQLPQHIRLGLRDEMADLFQCSVFNPKIKNLFSSARYAEKLLAGNLFPVDNLKSYLHVGQSFMQGEDTLQALTTADTQMYILAGAHSELFSPEAHEMMMQKAPLANLTIFKRSGHIPIIDRPIQFQKEFSRFLTEPTHYFRNKQIRYV